MAEAKPKSNIIFTGRLTIIKLKELCFKHLEIKSDSDEWNPRLNHNIISIIKQADGNFKGFTYKNNKLVESREGTPEHALVRLLTHE